VSVSVLVGGWKSRKDFPSKWVQAVCWRIVLERSPLLMPPTPVAVADHPLVVPNKTPHFLRVCLYSPKSISACRRVEGSQSFWTRNVRSSTPSNRIGGKVEQGRKNPQQQLAPCRGHQCGGVKRMGHCVRDSSVKRRDQTQPKREEVEESAREKSIFVGGDLYQKEDELSNSQQEGTIYGWGRQSTLHTPA
jgi:hypothetical protein